MGPGHHEGPGDWYSSQLGSHDPRIQTPSLCNCTASAPILSSFSPGFQRPAVGLNFFSSTKQTSFSSYAAPGVNVSEALQLLEVDIGLKEPPESVMLRLGRDTQELFLLQETGGILKSIHQGAPDPIQAVALDGINRVDRLRWVDHLRSGVQDEPGQHDKTPSLLKIQKLASVVVGTCNPSNGEAEAGETLEPRRQRLQRPKITPLHSSLGDRATLCLKRRRRRKAVVTRRSHTLLQALRYNVCCQNPVTLECLGVSIYAQA
ncbi:hypothetical protein AAY473_016076 [Plecturocebus cupreus]